ncbi:SCO6880 family protein [Microlunatus antarcticus]|uniref:PrgI family protein n=1 Tax=Microlunatus antarcticus TaxID=53388 RepID=A0A7W5JUC8_9ACTN|nr:SCO6880 family protein [Microlunatus antarcticus]MBB3326476.1 hypothetical protein [Microlunatus antarcticus]
MTGRVYRDYQRDRVGWFFGLTGTQLGLLTAGSLPVFWAAHVGWWSAAFATLVGWVGLVVLVVVPVRGRSAVSWAAASLAHEVGHLLGWTRWTSRLADGRATAPKLPDLPAPLDALRVHEATSAGPGGDLAVVEDPSRRTWTVVARLQHAGLDWLTSEEQDQRAAGLAALLDAACRTELVSEVQVLVRACPEDGAEREHWLTEHRTHTPNADVTTGAAATRLSRSVHDDLRRHLTSAATQTETFLVLVLPETRLRRQARQDSHARGARSSANPLETRLQLLTAAAREIGQQATAYLGVNDVRWLDPSMLAQACRAGFHLDAGVALADAQAAARTGTSEVEAEVPWAAAGPAHAEARPRSYLHDAWQSASVSVLLPPRGAVLGALAPVLAPGVAGERRCLLVAFPVMTATVADRVTASREWAADLGDGLRTRAGVRPRAKTRADHATARGVDAKLVAGAALCRPYAIATTTIPTGQAKAAMGEATRRLEAAVRRAGYAAQRLDLAHDTAFAAGCLPLGHTFTRTGSTS